MSGKRFIEQVNGNDDNNVKNKLCFDKKTRHILMAGVITWQLAEDFFNILYGFESLPSRKPLTVYINSDGGEIYAMFKIYDHIKNSPLFIITIVAGCATSAGFMVFLAGDLRKALPNAFLGFHAPTFFKNNGESPAESQESAIHQNYLLKIMIRIVKENSNMTEKNIKNHFSVLTMIDAKTALQFGLVSEIINPPKKFLPKSGCKI